MWSGRHAMYVWDEEVLGRCLGKGLLGTCMRRYDFLNVWLFLIWTEE